MLKVLILGCNSFIGKHLIAAALDNKDSILPTAFGRSFDAGFDKIRCVRGDFEDSAPLKEALKGQDVVYHLISQTIPSMTWNTPLSEIEKNLTPTLKFIELAAESGVKKICFASSGGTVYGLQQNLLTEESPTEPFSPHGIVKRATESFLQYARLRFHIAYDIYRISNVYGEGQDVNKGLGFINTALENIVNNRPVVVFGNGENTRDYIYVKDVANLLMLSTRKSLEDSDVYNISANHSVNLNELIALIKKVTQTDFGVQYVQERSSDNGKVFLDNSKIMSRFGETSLTSLEEGIKNTYAYLKKRAMYV